MSRPAPQPDRAEGNDVHVHVHLPASDPRSSPSPFPYNLYTPCTNSDITLIVSAGCSACTQCPASRVSNFILGKKAWAVGILWRFRNLECSPRTRGQQSQGNVAEAFDTVWFMRFRVLTTILPLQSRRRRCSPTQDSAAHTFDKQSRSVPLRRRLRHWRRRIIWKVSHCRDRLGEKGHGYPERYVRVGTGVHLDIREEELSGREQLCDISASSLPRQS